MKAREKPRRFAAIKHGADKKPGRLNHENKQKFKINDCDGFADYEPVLCGLRQRFFE